MKQIGVQKCSVERGRGRCHCRFKCSKIANPGRSTESPQLVIVESWTSSTVKKSGSELTLLACERCVHAPPRFAPAPVRAYVCERRQNATV